MTAPTIVDLRSDIYTQPTQGMRDAMANADVGREPMVSALEDRCARLLGKEKTIVVPTATMGNLICIMTHCELRGSQIILGSESHIGSTEHGHVSRIAGVFPRMFLEKDDGTLPLSDLEDVILNPVPANVCKTRLICLENTHNRCGGKILPLDYLKQVHSLAQENNIKVHVDGARLMNAAVGLGVDVKEITQYCDSIAFCLNKGIGAPVGCIVAGSEPFINRCWEHCKTLGGQMFQFGMMAAAAIYGLDRVEENTHRDHILAKRLANGLKNFSSSAVTVNPDEVETNIVFLRTHRDHSFVKELFKRLMTCTETEIAELGKEIHVTCIVMGKRIRLVTYFSITEQGIEDAIKKISYVMKEYQHYGKKITDK